MTISTHSSFNPEDQDQGGSELSSIFSEIGGNSFSGFYEHLLLQALDNNLICIHCILDKDMNILWANTVAQGEAKKYFGSGITRGESILKYTSPSHHTELTEKIKEALNGTSITYDRQISIPGGGDVLSTITIQPLLDLHGKLIALSYTAIDNTAKLLSESKVKIAEHTLSVLFDSLAQTYVLFDINHRVTWFNLKAHEEALELFGNPLAVGLSFEQILPPPFVPQMAENFKRVSKGETITYERNYPNRPDVWKQLVLGPVRDSSDKIIGIYFTSKDISDIKKALQISMFSEYKMRAIFDTSPDIHTLFSEDFKLIWANKEAVRNAALFFGEELKVGEDIGKFVGAQFKDNLFEHLEKVKSGTPVNYERFYPSIGGKDIWLALSMQSIQYSEDQSKRGISITIKNITDQKEYEERLRQVNKELVEQNQQLNQFSYIVSHNLRGPIASLMGLTQMLERDLKDKVQSEIIEGYKITVQRFDEIINDLTKILTQTNEADKTKSVISLEEEFSKVMDLQRNIISQLGADVTVDFAVANVNGVKSFVHSIFLNLLSNSIKYRNQDGQLKISVKSSMFNDKVLIEFSDNGMGINLDMYQDKLFNFYKRFHSHVEGKGLGLYLVKTQVELMRGKIDVKSKVGEGTTFYIYLPKAV